MIRIITTRRLRRILAANARHQTAHAVIAREKEGLRREVDAAIEREGRLTAELAILRRQRPSTLELLTRTHRAEDRARALDARLGVLQLASEAADRAATGAVRRVAS